MKNTARVFAGSFAVIYTLACCDNTQPPAVDGKPVETPAEQTVAVAELQTQLAAVARNVEAAEAVRSVKRLQWAYGHYSELGLWYDFADLFADSGIGHYVQGDLNRDQIRALFFDQVGQGRLGLADGRIYPHISFSPVVDLAEDGTHASARFRILAMLGGYGGNATWFHGVYENAYVQQQGVWQLNEISNTAQITGNFTAGLSATSKAPLEVPTFAFHYDSEEVGQLVTPVQQAVAAQASAAEPARDLLRSAADLYSLQQRLNRLDDEAALVNLQHQYSFQLDRHDWDALTALFAEQATFETAQQGVYRGKASIRNALNQFGSSPLAAGEVDDHILFQTYVSIAEDGLSAKARVDQLGLQGKQGVSAQWTQGIYENTFVKENGRWRIQSLHYYPRLITDYDKGWAADAQPAAGPSNTFPADAPPTEQFAAYPTFYIPAFHFQHPVTGRAPQYPAGSPASGKATGFASATEPTLGAGPLYDSATLPAQVAAAELRSQRMLATDAVENLVNAYAYYLDECMTQDVAALFAEQGVNEIPGIGFYKGAEKISGALKLAYCPNGRQENALTLHHVLQPVITVDETGTNATVVARLWQIHATGADDDYYLMGELRGAAIKQGAQWKLASLSTQYKWAVSVKEGWARATENETLGYAAPVSMLTELPPDRPTQSVRLAPFP